MDTDGHLSEFERDAKQITPLPWREVLLLTIIHVVQALQLTILLPMLVFMVPTYGIPNLEAKDVGRYVGFLAALYPLGQFCTSVLWGIISDRTGRKVWLVFGNVVTGVGAVLMGLAGTYWEACAVHLVNGCLNCTLLVSKATLAEYCDGTNLSKAFAMMGVSWGIGAIAGSTLGGLLADPCHLYKLEACPSFLSEHPFVLPFLAVAFASFLTTICATFLPETRSSEQQSYSRLAGNEREMDENLNGFGSIGYGYKEEAVVEREWVEEGVGRVQVVSSVYSIDDEDDDDFDYYPSNTKGKGMANGIEVMKGSGIRKGGIQMPKSGKGGGEDEEEGVEVSGKPVSVWQLIRDKDVLLVTLVYGLFGFTVVYTGELFPMFAASPVSAGGLLLSSASMGLLMGVGGVITIAYTLLLFPYLSRCFGNISLLRFSLLAFIPTILLVPASSLLVNSPRLEWAVLFGGVLLKSVILATGFTSIMVLNCNAATTETLGMVNGLGQSASFFLRTLAPAIAGVMWDFSVPVKIFGHQFISFGVAAGVAMLTSIGACFLSPTLDKPRDRNSFQG